LQLVLLMRLSERVVAMIPLSAAVYGQAITQLRPFIIRRMITNNISLRLTRLRLRLALPHVPCDIRRSQIIDTLKRKAEREGERVCVEGVLYIDDSTMFSVIDGFLNNNRNG
jgi:hypothetical protein